VKTRWLCLWQVRTKLNELDIVNRAERQHLETVVLSKTAANPDYNQPPETQSLMLLFKMHGPNGVVLAITHHYLRRDGTSSPHDPKFVRVANEKWIPRPCNSKPCPDCKQWQQKAIQTLSPRP